MAGIAFDRTLNPRLGKRERLATTAVVKNLTSAAYTIDGGAAGKLNDRLPSAAIIQVYTNAVWWTIDGTDPAAAVGFASAVGDTIYLDSLQQVRQFKVLRQAADGTIEVQYLYGT